MKLDLRIKHSCAAGSRQHSHAAFHKSQTMTDTCAWVFVCFRQQGRAELHIGQTTHGPKFVHSSRFGQLCGTCSSTHDSQSKPISTAVSKEGVFLKLVFTNTGSVSRRTPRWPTAANSGHAGATVWAWNASTGHGRKGMQRFVSLRYPTFIYGCRDIVHEPGLLFLVIGEWCEFFFAVRAVGQNGSSDSRWIGSWSNGVCWMKSMIRFLPFHLGVCMWCTRSWMYQSRCLNQAPVEGFLSIRWNLQVQCFC